MLNKYISEAIKNSFPYEMTAKQTAFCTQIGKYIMEQNSHKVFILSGYAGTGKTSVVAALVKALKTHRLRTVLLAPTGRAAKVFSEYAQSSAWTIHKHIYRMRTEDEGAESFELDYNKAKNTLFIIDEASMLSNNHSYSMFGSGCLLDDVFRFVFREESNNKLLLVGDSAQLPPVGLLLSHALDESYIREEYHFDVEEVRLTEVIRQQKQSGILGNATWLRNCITEGCNGKLELSAAEDVHFITGGELIEQLTESYEKEGQQETIVITRSNKRANAYNEGVRRTILYREDEIAVGDMLMVVKNNYYWKDEQKKLDFIANGEIAEVLVFRKIEELYGFRFADVCLRFVDYDMELDVKILLDTLTSEAPALTQEQNKILYKNVAEDYTEIRNKKKRRQALRENPYFNALQVKFSYAVTCHKSQGGQWSTVFIDQGYLVEDMLNTEYYRWLYTAVTRAKKKLCFVNFREKYQRKV